MLIIPPKAFAVMSEREESRFVSELVIVLRENAPCVADESSAETEAQVCAQITVARGDGMTSERAVATHVLTAVPLGLDFAGRFRAAAEILASELDVDRKAERLSDFTLMLFNRLA